MGDYRSFTLPGGGTADVPVENVDKWLARMQARGVSGIAPAEVEADMQVGEPETIRGPSMEQRFMSQGGGDEGGGFKPWSGPSQIPMQQSSSTAAPEPAYAGLIDAGRGFAQGALGGGVDELGGLGGGDMANMQHQDAVSAERSPGLYNVARGIGGLPRNLAGGFLASLAQGGAEGALSSDGGFMDRAKGAAMGAGTAGAMHGLGQGMEATARGVGTPIRALGVATRRASATGASPENLGTIRQERGIDFMENGLDKRFEELGLAGSPLPQSAGGVYRKIGQEGDPDALLGQAGQRMGGAMDRAGEQGIRGDLTSVDQTMANRMRGISRAEVKNPESKGVLNATQAIRDELPIAPRSAYGRDPSEPPELPINANNMPMKSVGQPPSQRYADWLGSHEAETFADDVPFPADVSERAVGYNPNLRTPRELHTQKTEFDKGGYTNDLAPQSERVGAQAQRIGAGAYKAELDDAMQRSGPDNYADYEGGRQDFQDLSLLGDLSGKRADQNAGAAAFKNPFMYGGATAGAAAGGMLGSVAGPAGSMLGAGLGMAAGGKLGQKYGQDVAGLGLMGVGKAIRGGGQMGNAAMQGGVSPAIGAEQSRDEAYGGGADLERGRGYMLTEVVQEALRNEPDVLGQYVQPFAAAAASQEKSALSALITKLSRTDPFFRQNVLPALRERTQEGGY